eukprot:13246.XXX_674330_674452_1 [CDS] Oithona nana genome sequencing.
MFTFRHVRKFAIAFDAKFVIFLDENPFTSLAIEGSVFNWN